MGNDLKKKPGLENFDFALNNQNLNNQNKNPISNFYFDQFQNPISGPNLINSENNINNRVASNQINYTFYLKKFIK